MTDGRQILVNAAKHLQGKDTAYFSDLALLRAISLLYRLADQVR